MDSPKETLKELVAEIHHLQQLVREKDLQIKRNEVSHSFSVNSRISDKMVQCILVNQFIATERHLCPKTRPTGKANRTRATIKWATCS